MKRLTSLILCAFLFCSFVSCTQNNKDINTAEQEQQTMETVEAGDVVFENIDTIIGGRYRTVANDETMILEKKIYPSYPSIDYWESFEYSDMKTEYYQYDGFGLKKLHGIDQYVIEEDYDIPFYINSSNEIYYRTGNGLMVIEKDSANSYTSLNLDFGSMIYKGKCRPWILFHSHNDMQNEYILYNLDDHMQYSFAFENRIHEFYKYDDTIIFVFDVEEKPFELHYGVYSIDESNSSNETTSDNEYIIAKSEPDDLGNTSQLNMYKVSSLTIPPSYELSLKDLNITFPEGTEIIGDTNVILTDSSSSGPMMSDIDINDFNQDTSELVWMPHEKNQINISDVNTGELKETILSDEIISQVFPFTADDSQGTWFLPALTSIGLANHVYLLTWKNNEPALQKYYIGNYWFNNNSFIDENGMLYVISTDLTSGTVKYDLLLIDPNNSNQLSKYSVVTSGRLLQNEISGVQFSKVQSMPGQILIQALANTNLHQFDEHLSAIYKIQFKK